MQAINVRAPQMSMPVQNEPEDEPSKGDGSPNYTRAGEEHRGDLSNMQQNVDLHKEINHSHSSSGTSLKASVITYTIQPTILRSVGNVAR